MRRFARLRPRVALVGVMLLAACHGAEFTPTRSRPTRPGEASVAVAAAPSATAATELPAVRFGKVEYVDAAAFGASFGLKFAWIEADKRFQLSSRTAKFEGEVDRRECLLDGVRIFLGDPVRPSKGRPLFSRIDAERQLAPLLLPGTGEARVPDAKIIVLDPGHGGADQGTENPRLGLREKDLALDVAFRLKKLLEAQGWRVVLTRDSDINPPLALRADVANRAGADVFCSIHFNAVAGDTRTHGSEVFTFAPRTQRSTDSWGKNEDDSEAETAPANRCDRWSAVLAHALHRKLLEDLHTEDRGKKIAHWGVLRPLQCPGVLVEPAFLSNEAEAKQVATPAFRQRIAEALADGLQAYAVVLDGVRRKLAADLRH